MKMIYMNWPSFGREDILDALTRFRGKDGAAEVVCYPFENTEKRRDAGFEERFAATLIKEKPDMVFSFNYYPLISQVCNTVNVKYISWVFDSPCIALYSYTLINPCNQVFVFDHEVYELFAGQGIKTVEYLPLAASVRRLDGIVPDGTARSRYGADISFVGAMYSEEHTFYERMEPKLDDYTRGYLEGLMRSQLQVSGVNFVEECLTPQVIESMIRVYPIQPNADGVESSAWIYANYVLNRRITQIERTELIRAVGRSFGGERIVALYTRDAAFRAEGVENRGVADYYTEMPCVFKCSKINLNITLRSIKRGIPLRAFDIMGAGGFLLTNYQEDLLDFFVPGEDLVYYEDERDMLNKIEYYLEHDDEREAIARSGHDKIARAHTWDDRLSVLLGDVEKS